MRLPRREEREAERKLACLCCEKQLSPIFPGAEFQPSGGIMCSSHGNYGSSVFDTLEDEELLFFICDVCLKARIPFVYLIRRESQILSASEELYECVEVEMEEKKGALIGKR